MAWQPDGLNLNALLQPLQTGRKFIRRLAEWNSIKDMGIPNRTYGSGPTTDYTKVSEEAEIPDKPKKFTKEYQRERGQKKGTPTRDQPLVEPDGTLIPAKPENPGSPKKEKQFRTTLFF